MSLCTRFNPTGNLPCDEKIYIKCVGRFLVGVLRIIFQELGFQVQEFHQQRNGIDMAVYYDKRCAIVLEIKNWNITSRLTDGKRKKVIINLSKYDCHRLFLYTNPISKVQLDTIESKGINLLEIGFQILRKPCYDYFEQTGNRIIGRRIFTNSIKAEIRSKILEFLDNEYYSIKNLRYLFE